MQNFRLSGFLSKIVHSIILLLTYCFNIQMLCFDKYSENNHVVLHSFSTSIAKRYNYLEKPLNYVTDNYT